MAETSAELTFLFTDIEASTRRWEDDPSAMSVALERHDVIARGVVAANGGVVVKHTGDGVLAEFPTATAALGAAVEMQRRLAPDDVRVRAGLHTGHAEHRDGDYFGTTLNRAARIMALGRGGHVLMSEASARTVRMELPVDITLTDLGQHSLKGLENPEHIFQAVGPGLLSEPALVRSEARFLGRSRTLFIGRQAQIAALVRLVEGERCVTITGVGGAGKTRLAIEVARALSNRFRDGACLVELAALADPADVVQAVAEGVGMPVVSGSVARDLTIFLRDRQCLIVLDNCEHVLDAAADLVDALLAACSEVTVLATSREALGVEGERSWQAPSLVLPPDAADPDPVTYESGVLFVARATVVHPSLVPGEHRRAIAEICRRLDGHPLAIELAAARSSHLSPEQIAGMLDDRFRLLTGGARGARQRQQTLQATMDWSHDLLSHEEQVLLRRLAVFADGWTLDAAAFVCGHGAALTVVDGLASLVAKSLVIVEEAPEGSWRYRMLESVRLYALERLTDAGEQATLRDRHLGWLVHWARDLAGPADSLRPTRWGGLAERELENLRAGLVWADGQGRGDQVVVLIAATFPMWFYSARSPEGLAWLDALAFGVDEALDLADRVQWRVARGFLLQESLGVEAEVARCGREILRLDPDGTTSPLSGLGWLFQIAGPLYADPPRAIRIGAEALDWLDRNAGDTVAQSVSAFYVNALLIDRRFDQAEEVLVGLLAEPGFDPYLREMARTGLATLRHLAGDDEAAAVHLGAVIDAIADPAPRHIDSWTYSLLAIVEAARGNRAASRAALRTATACVRRRYGHIPSAWGFPITAAAILHALDHENHEAMALLVGVGAQGRQWQGRGEQCFVLHRRYTEWVADRMTPEEVSKARQVGNRITIDAMRSAVDAVGEQS